MNLSAYNNIFCDSKEALEWAYGHGLPKNSQVRTSSPALLFSGNSNIKHVESRWNVEEFKRFQDSIKILSENIYDVSISVDGIDREIALAVSQSAVTFQKVLFKIACLDEKDFINPRLFVQVEGKSGPSGNNMNSPWANILSGNKLFKLVSYNLKNDNWNVLNTRGITYWERYKLAGRETLIYRALILIMKFLPSWAFKREVFVPNENELIVETAASLMLQGVKVTELNIDHINKNVDVSNFIDDLYNSASVIMQERIKEWVVPAAVNPAMLLFKSHIINNMRLFNQFAKAWDQILLKNNRTKQVILMNASGGIKGQALSHICKKKDIDIIGVQHGVTVEISRMHGEVSTGFDNSIPKATLYFNYMCAKVESNSYFSNSKSYVVGSSSRHIRIKNDKVLNKTPINLVYVSTNLYRGNLGYFITCHTDYDRAKKERDLVIKVLCKVPHKILYKTYPEDNRRYADKDPVLDYIKNSNNITLFDKKVDMRYLVSKYKVFITSGATSTLSWLVMSGKPVIFINRKEKSPLTSEARTCFSKGMFVFNDDEKDFDSNLIKFLSQSISDIEYQWSKKKNYRKHMVEKYFSAYESGAGKRAAKIILKEYLS
jgi:hypothetical protein